MIAKRWASVIALLAVVAMSAPPATATHIQHEHAGSITNVGGNPCDVNWGHIAYTNESGYGFTDEIGSTCSWVQVAVRWYFRPTGYQLAWGPALDLYSDISSGDIVSIQYSAHCGGPGGGPCVTKL